MINLILSSCILLEGFTWRVNYIAGHEVKLVYPVIVRTELNNKTVEVIETKGMLWKRKYVEQNSKDVVCPKLYKGLTK